MVARVAGPPGTTDSGELCICRACFCNGILTVFVSITVGCAIMEPWESLIIGFVGGFVYQGTSLSMQVLKLDDVVDGFVVHGACGF